MIIFKGPKEFALMPLFFFFFCRHIMFVIVKVKKDNGNLQHQCQSGRQHRGENHVLKQLKAGLPMHLFMTGGPQHHLHDLSHTSLLSLEAGRCSPPIKTPQKKKGNNQPTTKMTGLFFSPFLSSWQMMLSSCCSLLPWQEECGTISNCLYDISST